MLKLKNNFNVDFIKSYRSAETIRKWRDLRNLWLQQWFLTLRRSYSSTIFNRSSRAYFFDYINKRRKTVTTTIKLAEDNPLPNNTKLTCIGGLSIQAMERLSMTFTANGKRQKWNFCRLSSAVSTVEWTYLYLQWIIGEVFPFLCALFTD